MTKLVVFVLFNIPLLLFSQEGIALDTIFVKRDLGQVEIDTYYIEAGVAFEQWLIGTTILKNSPKNIELRNKGFEIKAVWKDTCDATQRYLNREDYPKVKSIDMKPGEIIAAVELIANCCSNFLVEGQILQNNELNLVYHEYGGFCSCTCKYSLIYILELKKEIGTVDLEFVSVGFDSKNKIRIE